MKSTDTSHSNGGSSFDGSAALGPIFLRRLLKTPRGRAFQLNFMVYAEEADEQGVFDTLLARVDDAELRRLVRVHRDDESRHARMLRECVARVGVEPEAMPDSLRIIDRIDRHVGGLARLFVGGRSGVMEAYLLLQVIEERGVRQFPVIAEAMRPFDAESAAVIDRITQDERRHVKYAKAISRRYAPDPQTLERVLAHFRRAETRAFEEHTRELLRFAVARNLNEARGLSGCSGARWLRYSQAARPLLGLLALLPLLGCGGFSRRPGIFIDDASCAIGMHASPAPETRAARPAHHVEHALDELVRHGLRGDRTLPDAGDR